MKLANFLTIGLLATNNLFPPSHTETKNPFLPEGCPRSPSGHYNSDNPSLDPTSRLSITASGKTRWISINRRERGPYGYVIIGTETTTTSREGVTTAALLDARCIFVALLANGPGLSVKEYGDAIVLP